MKTSPTANVDRNIKAIVEMAEIVSGLDEVPPYVMTIGFAIGELVRQELRAITQEGEPLPNRDNLLQRAMQRVNGYLSERLQSRAIAFDLSSYEAEVRTQLEPVASEMQSLSWELAKSKQDRRVSAREDAVAASMAKYQLSEIGLRDAPEGLLAEPLAATTVANVEAIVDNWRVEGEWFPYEIHCEDFIFVLDDDGSLFVSIENLPASVRPRAVKLLHALANRLYLR